MRALVTGAEGQLGRALVARLGRQVAWAGGRAELDVRDPEVVGRLLEKTRPDVVFNAAAYNDVERAERNVREALAVNAAGPAHLASGCRAGGALLVHVSTDYVFDGAQAVPYREDDAPHPLGAYGVSKLAGELLVAASGVPHLVVRTSAVYGQGGSRVKGGSFVDRVLTRARAGERLRVVTDQVFSPTYAPDLAAGLIALVEHGARGLFHVTGAGSCSWHELATAAVEIAGLSVKVKVEPLTTPELGSAVRRPAYSVLSGERYAALGLPPLRPWRAALEEHLRS